MLYVPRRHIEASESRGPEHEIVPEVPFEKLPEAVQLLVALGHYSCRGGSDHDPDR